MRRLYVACALAFAACAVDQQQPADVDPSTQEIVRGKDEKKLPQVVAVHVNSFNGVFVHCSGTYFASRVVVTAAHCLRFANDPRAGLRLLRSGLPDRPDGAADNTGARSAVGVGARRNGRGASELRRQPELSRHRASCTWIASCRSLRSRCWRAPHDRRPINKGEIAGWGGSKALTADITQVEGAGIKRSAMVKILGTPTEADFHPDDPNPGILDPAIRANLRQDRRHGAAREHLRGRFGRAAARSR